MGWVRRVPEIYLGFALAVTGLLCFATAPFFAPDEANQSLRAITLAHGQLIAPAPADEAGGYVDEGSYRVMDLVNQWRMAWEKRSQDFRDRPWGAISHVQEEKLADVRWDRQSQFAGFGNTAVYPPMLYVPAMVGWRIGEAADWTIFASLRLARVLCALTGVLVSWLALRLWVGSRALLLAVLLLPSAMFLYGASSQDALMVPLAALAAALLTRALADGREFHARELWGLVLVLACVAAARPPYAALAFVLFLPGVEARARGWRPWIGSAAGFALIVAVCAGWHQLVAHLAIDTAQEADPELQAAFLRSHPLTAAAAVARGTAEAGWDFVHRGLYVIGWNDLLPHHGAAAVLALCLAAILLASRPVPMRTLRGYLVLCSAVAAPLLAISLAEYVIWTPPGLGTVYGVQPRYWLPVMPLCMILLGGRVPGFAGRRWLAAAGCVLMGGVAATLPWMAAHAFYGAGLWNALRMNL
jgi:uncharacterized membrane protein